MRPGQTLARPLILPHVPCKEKTMFYDTSASHRPRRTSLLAIAFRPWQMLADLMTERQTHATLLRLDDHTLKDIGISRGSIRSAIRDGRIRN
jgi:uncharacterized protein YjiS (DUF1127 family)